MAQIFNGAQRLSTYAPADGSGGAVQRVAVLGSLTTTLIAKAVACSIFRDGTVPVVYEGLYGAYVQELLDRSSALYAFAPDAVVLAPDWRDLVTAHSVAAGAADVERSIAAKADLFSELWTALKRSGCTIFQHVLVPPAERYRGAAERRSALRRPPLR
jgi:predicted enzyme involved in methoxymalonyl-ACP biosynthesis